MQFIFCLNQGIEKRFTIFLSTKCETRSCSKDGCTHNQVVKKVRSVCQRLPV